MDSQHQKRRVYCAFDFSLDGSASCSTAWSRCTDRKWELWVRHLPQSKFEEHDPRPQTVQHVYTPANLPCQTPKLGLPCGMSHKKQTIPLPESTTAFPSLNHSTSGVGKPTWGHVNSTWWPLTTTRGSAVMFTRPVAGSARNRITVAMCMRDIVSSRSKDTKTSQWCSKHIKPIFEFLSEFLMSIAQETQMRTQQSAWCVLIMKAKLSMHWL